MSKQSVAQIKPGHASSLTRSAAYTPDRRHTLGAHTCVQRETARSAASPVAPVRNGVLQRKCACGGTPGLTGECEACREKRLQRKRNFGSKTQDVSEVPSIVHDVLRSPGQSLDAPTRVFMEPRFNRDFAHVRVHTDANAIDSALGVNADAYTVGRHIVFGSGRYAPDSSHGKLLLAHELAHTIQQGEVSNDTPLEISNPTDPAEHEAEAASTAALAGRAFFGRHNVQPILARQRGTVELQPNPYTTPAPGSGSSTNPAAQQTQNAPRSTQATRPAVPTKSARESMDPVGRPGFPVQGEVYRGTPADPAVLTVTLRYQAIFAERPLGTNPGRPIPLPSPAEQKNWRSKFSDRVGKSWSLKHYLDLDAPCPGERPRAVVNFRAVDQSPPHVRIYVYGWTPDGWRSYVRGSEMHLDIGDLDPTFISGQVVAAHETGHSLGLGHIGCDTNDSICYGTFDAAADIMGRGPTVSARDYQTFADIMAQITGCRWKVTPASGPPHNYLPTAVGFALGVLGAVAGGAIGFLLGGPLGAFIGAGIGGLGLGFGTAALVGLTGGTAS